MICKLLPLCGIIPFHTPQVKQKGASMDDAQESLQTFLATTRDTREYKRALAVQMVYQGIDYDVIMTLLRVSRPFISKWKRIFAEQGVDGLRLGYRGSTSFLTAAQREQTLEWLRTQESWSVPALRIYLYETFQVVYQSLQSYYDLMYTAGLSWHKTEARNPKKKEVLVAARSDEIRTFLAAHAEEIRKGERIVFFLDECFLIWQDACGYAWGKQGEVISLPIENVRKRQAYYGAVNVMTGIVHLVPYDVADALSTADFLMDLRLIAPDAKLTILWDNASHHKAATVQAYLAEVNAHVHPEEWPITCLWFAPHDPSQNPMEAIWNQAKTFVRRHWNCWRTFLDITNLFETFIKEHIFDFPKLYSYCPDLQMI